MRLVVLGTGTDVGKTYVTALLAVGLARRARVLALKPIESGVAPGVAGDAGVLAEKAGHPAILSSWRFPRGVSPHLASRDQGITIDVAQVAAWVEAREREHAPAITLIESAGGALSPLAAGVSNVELALAVQPAVWVLVASDSLGVLHDISATLRALPRRPDAVVLSSARAPDASTGSNAVELRRLQICEVLAEIGRDCASADPLVEWVLKKQSFSSS